MWAEAVSERDAREGEQNQRVTQEQLPTFQRRYILCWQTVKQSPANWPETGLDLGFSEASYLLYLLNNKHKLQNVSLIYDLPAWFTLTETEVCLHTKAKVVFGC